MFFDDEELDDIQHDGLAAIEAAESAVTATDAGKGNAARRTCPACQSAMHGYPYLYNSPIMLNACNRCNGIYVQHGDLLRMQVYLKEERADNSLAAEAAFAVAHLSVSAAAHRARQRQIERFLKYAAQPISPATHIPIGKVDI